MRLIAIVGLAGAMVATQVLAFADVQRQPSLVDKRETQEQLGVVSSRDISVSTWLSKTALWIGDQIVYTIEIICAPRVDILVDDLAKEKLRLEGLEVVAANTERTAHPSGGVTYRFTYRLTTYEIGNPIRKIGDLTVRSYVPRPGLRIEDAIPAGDVRVPGVVLAWRSTLPDDLQTIAPRDVRTETTLPRALFFAGPIGVALLMISGVPVALWLVALLRRERRPRPTLRSTREAKNRTRSAVEDLQNLEVETEVARRAAYTQLDAVLRGHLAAVSGIPTLSLTADEVTARVGVGGAGVPTEGIGTLLAECERARYGPSHELPGADQFRGAIVMMQEILASARR